MGKQFGQKNVMRTPEEKEKIVLEHLNNHTSLTELANKYSTTRGLIRQWRIKYLKDGYKGLVSKTGTVSGSHHKNMGINLRNPKSREEQLELEIMRKDIYDELPQYTKLFIQSKVGILLNKPGLALKGTCRP